MRNLLYAIFVLSIPLCAAGFAVAESVMHEMAALQVLQIGFVCLGAGAIVQSIESMWTKTKRARRHSR